MTLREVVTSCKLLFFILFVFCFFVCSAMAVVNGNVLLSLLLLVVGLTFSYIGSINLDKF
jgi:hypothetical protein